MPRVSLPERDAAARLDDVEETLGDVVGKVDLIYDFLAARGALPRPPEVPEVPEVLVEAIEKRGPGLHHVRVPAGDRMVLAVIDGDAGGDPETTYDSILRAVGQPPAEAG
jgi:hypothetical protein